ncbi:MAG: patatin-like phospholipase family protein [Actinomycetota bacterium]|nr:patatin-like phospholipase family protein [Actinomycetota bacterium]
MAGVKVGLALGSGSANGLAHIGVLKVLEREGIGVDMIAGTSIGALIGGFSASGLLAKEIEKIAVSFDLKKLASLVDLASPTKALVSGNKVEGFIREQIGGKSFDDLKIPFACVATDLVSGEEIVFSQGDVADAIRSSIATPVIFSPVEDSGGMLVDGGVVNPVPVDVARGMGADVVIAVSVLGLPKMKIPTGAKSRVRNGFRTGKIKKRGFPRIAYSKAAKMVRKGLQPPTIYQVFISSLDIMQRELSELKLKAADIIIAPQIEDTNYFSYYEAPRIIDLGEKAAEEALDLILGIIEERGAKDR